MKHTVLALALSTGLLASGCAHGGGSSAHQLDATSTLVLVGVAVAGVALITAGATAGTKACTDPLGRCGDYQQPLPGPR
jgi:hypothetical protein